MYENLSDEEIESTLTAVAKLWPEVESRMKAQLELLTAQPVLFDGTQDFSEIRLQMRRVVALMRELESLPSNPLVGWDEAKKLKKLLNQLLRTMIPGIPRNQTPLHYMVQQVEKLSEIPRNIQLPPELDYRPKHLGLHGFVRSVVGHLGSDAVEKALYDAIENYVVIETVQKVSLGTLLPPGLTRDPLKSAPQRADRAKQALRNISGDWEALVSLVYGLVRLGQDGKVEWDRIREVKLWDKVERILREPLLRPLAKQDWVTVRNALDHGRAPIIPGNSTIEFHDLTRKVIWPIDQARLEAMDMSLANCAMLRTWNFATAELARPLIELSNMLERVA